MGYCGRAREMSVGGLFVGMTCTSDSAKVCVCVCVYVCVVCVCLCVCVWGGGGEKISAETTGLVN
jgi:hypothetical protein